MGHRTSPVSSQAGESRGEVPEDPLSLSLQTLESIVLQPDQEKGLSVQDLAWGSPIGCLPSCIREIVSRNLNQPKSPGATPSIPHMSPQLSHYPTGIR